MKKALLGFGFAAGLALLPFGGGQASAQHEILEPADNPGSFIVVEPSEIIGLDEIGAGPLVITGAYASVGDTVADVEPVVVPLGELVAVI